MPCMCNGSASMLPTVSRMIGEPMRVHGLAGRRAANARVRELLQIVGLPADAAGRNRNGSPNCSRRSASERTR